MASWKEKGVVPDSDDDESLDSQSDAGQENELRLNDPHNHDGIVEKENRGNSSEDLEAETFVLAKAALDDNTIHEERNLPPHATGPSKPEI
jgi:hypothetical protein